MPEHVFSIPWRVIFIVLATVFTASVTVYTYPPKALREKFARFRKK